MADDSVHIDHSGERGNEPTGEGNTGSVHHHHHHRSPWRRIKHAIRHNRKVVVPALFIGLIILTVSGIMLYGTYREGLNSRIQSIGQHETGVGYLRVSYKGKQYRYNSRITSILFAGIDSKGKMKVQPRYRFGSRADSINLVVLDEYNKKMTIIAISRNTMTPIHKYTLYGHDRGEFLDEICGSFCYGDNGEASCKNLCDAVSTLLYSVPIKDYVVSNRSSFTSIGEIVGDVKVKVPNDDLAKYGYYAGDTAIINSSNIARFLRHRDLNVQFSNNGRMERQKAYMNGAMKQIVRMLQNKPTAVWNKVQAMENYMQTNITRSRYIDLTNALSDLSYGEQDFYSPDGKNTMGEQFEEFYVDEDKLLEKVIEIFYIEE